MVLISVVHHCSFVHNVFFRSLFIQYGALSPNQENREESNTNCYYLSSFYFWAEIYDCCCVSSCLQMFLYLTHCGQQKWYSQGEVMTSFEVVEKPLNQVLLSHEPGMFMQLSTFRSGRWPCCLNGTGMAGLPDRQRHYSLCPITLL